jgi:phosphoserine phosphatase RsbU/P
MKIKKAFYTISAMVLFIGAFVIEAALKNIEYDMGFLTYLRGTFVLLGFVLIYFFIDIKKKEVQRTIVQRIGRIAMWVAAFIGLYIVATFMPMNGFESRELQLIPNDYITILFATVVSVAAGVVALVTLLNLKDMLLYKRKRGTKRNYWLLIGSFFGASVTAYNLRPLDASIYTTIFFLISILLIIVNSFRLSWIVSLSRREKIYSMLYALLCFFGFIALSVIMQERWFLFKALRYFSYPLQIFVQLTALLGAVYFGMTFISTLFHLPMAEAFDRKQTELSSLHNLSRLITQVFDFDELAETVTRMVFEVCGATSAWLEIFPPESSNGMAKRKDPIVSRKNISSAEIESVLFGAEYSVRSLVLSSKKVLLVDDVGTDRRTKYINTVRKLGSMLVVPLVSHDAVIGVLYATKEMDFGFDQEDIEVLSGFADQATVAIENARLIERSIEKERLQRELLLAQEMQKRLLPQNLPRFQKVDMQATSAPALEVGGDYYDIVSLSDRRVGIVIGDVSGKGVGAAFYMAEVKGIFQSLSTIYSSPKEFLVKANEALLSSIDKHSFISLIYAIMDVETGELILARAGHCPMLYVSKTKTEYVTPTGMGLGLTAGKVFADAIEEKKIQLKQGDICVFYTDGVTESRSATGEEFGYERLVQIVEQHRTKSAEEIKEEIIQGVWRYTDEKGYDDDLTVFIVKWNA